MARPADTAPAPARRGRRADQIAAAAGELFRTLGYQNVGIDQIGAAVGLTGPAVYRHFKGKNAILVAALMRQVAMVDELAIRADTAGGTPRQRFDLLLDGLGDLTAHHDEATLWRREQRHLEPAQRAVFEENFVQVTARIADGIHGVRPELPAADAELLGFAVLTMYSNTSGIRGTLTPERLRELQSAVARAIAACELPAATEPPPPAAAPRLPAGRRERILAAATELFDERGFYDVRIDDIAAGAEMSVSTLYQYANSKTEVLRAILHRGAEGLLYVTAETLAAVTDPAEVLDALIAGYIRQTLGMHGRIMRILAADLLYLPEQEQTALRETQREYVAEWVQAILARNEGLATDDARALALAAIGVLTDISQHPRLRARPGVATKLAAIARAAVLTRIG
ncbi:TetR/AcrR family transcriptional regulator [Nocardia asteroides]|uniref:TetR/AcrR family transcriptional regulator n=1 Tax=Nocardia asteroides TaxID=1824 RepID=UPI001E41B20B|nr:TetR/AcrR family transcriptional regulator [Nocardia asteroides]UGT62481.1 TetR/AcrR family transcriptional regulator [Nocardia asteroides]